MISTIKYKNIEKSTIYLIVEKLYDFKINIFPRMNLYRFFTLITKFQNLKNENCKTLYIIIWITKSLEKIIHI